MVRKHWPAVAFFTTLILSFGVFEWLNMPRQEALIEIQLPVPQPKREPASQAIVPFQPQRIAGAVVATVGPTICGTGSNDTSYGSHAWNDANEIASDDVGTAGCTISTDLPTNYLKASNFGWTIPGTATIEGIQVEWKRGRAVLGPSVVTDSRIRVGSGSTIYSADKATATNWPTSNVMGTATYGGAADPWSRTWTVAEANAFIAVLSCIGNDDGNSGSAQVAFCKATIWYTDSIPDAVGSMSNPASNWWRMLTRDRWSLKPSDFVLWQPRRRFAVTSTARVISF